MRRVLSGAVFWLFFGLCVILILPSSLLLSCGMCLFNLGDRWAQRIKGNVCLKDLF